MFWKALRGQISVYRVCTRTLIISLLWFSGRQIRSRRNNLPVIPSIDRSLCGVPVSGPFSGTAFLLPIPSVAAAVSTSELMLLKRVPPESRAWVLFYGPHYIDINTLWLLLDKKVAGGKFAPPKASRVPGAVGSERSAGAACDHSWQSTWSNPPRPLPGGQKRRFLSPP